MKKRIYIYTLLILSFTWLLSLASCLSKQQLLFDLASHFRVHYLLLACLCLLITVIIRAYVASIASVILLLFNLLFIVPWYINADEVTAKTDDTIKILMNNVLTRNLSANALKKIIKNENPDVILLLETNHRWLEDLAELNHNYPYSLLKPRSDNFGIALYSKFAITKQAVQYYGATSVPSVEVSFSTKQGEFTFIGTHPLPPLNEENYASRNAQLHAIAKHAAISTFPIVVAGDLNSTMWSTHYQVLETIGNLKNTRQGYGVAATWPAGLSTFGIPIDHILISSDFIVHDFTIGENTGSDHSPIIVSLSLKETRHER